MTTPNPTTAPQEIFLVLCDAVSQDPSKVKTAADRLAQIQKEQGAYDSMHAIAAERTVPLDVRRMAIIQVKNAIAQNWRTRSLYTDDQRANVRARSATFFDEPDDTIAECNAIIVSKIARNEYPRVWPSLIPDLMGLLNANTEARFNSPTPSPQTTLILRRTLKVLNDVFKELAAMKMPSHLETMATLAADSHAFLGTIYDRFITAFQSSLSPDTLNDPVVIEDLRIAHLAYKILVKIMVWIAPKTQPKYAALHPVLAGFFQVSVTKFQALADLRIGAAAAQAGIAQPSPTIEVLTAHVRLFGKFFRRVQQSIGNKFVSLPSVMELVMFYFQKVVQSTQGPPELIDDSPTAVFPVHFIVQGLVLFRESIRLWAPKNAMMDSSTPEVLSEEFVRSAVELLVTRFFPLRPIDLERWNEDPEGRIDTEESESWEYDLRPCAERVLLTLSTQHAGIVGPLLQEQFNRAVDPQTAGSLSLLMREAIYCAVGRCARSLRGLINLEVVLETTLAQQAVEPNPDPTYRILKRTIGWMLGKWFAEHGAPPPTIKVWEVLSHLLQDRQSGSDIVVRLVAATSLRECVDSLTFNVDDFSHFLHPIVHGLVALIMEAETVECQRRVTDALSTVIERSETRITDFIPVIVQNIPEIWSRPETDVLFKGSLLSMVTKLVGASKDSSKLTHIVLPLVRESFAPGVNVQLDADGLLLWLAAIRNASGMDTSLMAQQESLFDLLPLALKLLSENLDLLGDIIAIIEGYLLLDGRRVLQTHAQDLHHAFLNVLKQALESNVKGALQAIQLMVQVAPSGMWAEAMHASGLFNHLVMTAIDDKVTALIIVEHYFIFSRICLDDPRVFVQLMNVSNGSLSQVDFMNGLLDQWWKKFDNVGEPKQRKLMVMGIACLASTGHQEVISRLPTETFDMWVDVLTEIKEAQDEAPQDGIQSPLTAFWREETTTDPDVPEDVKGTIEEQRRQEVWVRDPVRNQTFLKFLRAKLQEIEMACGSQAFQTLVLDKADKSVFEQLQRLLDPSRPKPAIQVI